jgi:glucosamine--fructose-6-phosphate aminotransferase (isomerizing)
MCGIVGVVSRKPVARILINGLVRQEYRGYDSSGIAIFSTDHKEIQLVRRVGKVEKLQRAVDKTSLKGTTGIAHTRWATHGMPSERNSHPHQSKEKIFVVHNGIIENHQELRKELEAKGYKFSSDTDTEVIAHLIESYSSSRSTTLTEATKKAVKHLRGSYAFAVIHSTEPHHIVAARKGSPLVLGLGKGANFLASDQLAISGNAEAFVYLEDEDIAEITPDSARLWDGSNNEVFRPLVPNSSVPSFIDKGDYSHFMLKEIFEQPQKIKALLGGSFISAGVQEERFGPKAPSIFSQVKAIKIVACGTSYHAGLVGKYWLEDLAGLPCDVEVASEFRYRDKIVASRTLLVFISQSGETADTLECLRASKNIDYIARLGICNVPTSSLARESDLVFLTKAGPEIAVASTKAFTTQLVALLMLTSVLGRRNKLSAKAEKDIKESLETLPDLLSRVLGLEPAIKRMAASIDQKKNILFLARGIHYPIAMEGALKLKEISYIHAEAYPAGELKHGPLALIDAGMPVIAVAPNNQLLGKLQSNLQEVRARGGQIYVFGHSITSHQGTMDQFIEIPEVPESITPIIYTIPLQLLSFHVASLKGTDIDKPRNLAKSVTVE